MSFSILLLNYASSVPVTDNPVERILCDRRWTVAAVCPIRHFWISADCGQQVHEINERIESITYISSNYHRTEVESVAHFVVICSVVHRTTSADRFCNRIVLWAVILRLDYASSYWESFIVYVNSSSI